MKHLFGLLAGNCFSKSMCCNTRWGLRSTFILCSPIWHVKIKKSKKKWRKTIFYSWSLGVHARMWIVTGRPSSAQYQSVKGLHIKHGDGVCICYQAAEIFKGRNREWVHGRKEDAALSFCIYGLFIWTLYQHLNMCFKCSILMAVWKDLYAPLGLSLHMNLKAVRLWNHFSLM